MYDSLNKIDEQKRTGRTMNGKDGFLKGSVISKEREKRTLWKNKINKFRDRKEKRGVVK